MADDLRAGRALLGCESSPAFARQPEGKGCLDRVIRVVMEHLRGLRRFGAVADLRLDLPAFRRAHNQGWILEHHALRTPAQVRARYTAFAWAA